jgi:hypothetical protein
MGLIFLRRPEVDKSYSRREMAVKNYSFTVCGDTIRQYAFLRAPNIETRCGFFGLSRDAIFIA